MKIVRILSSILFYVTRLLASLYFATGIYAIIALVLNESKIYSGLVNITGIRFEIFYPGTNTPFLLGDYIPGYLIPMFTLVLLYGAFFWLLGDVFLAFKSNPLFTSPAVRKLTRFWRFNIIVPALALLTALVISMDVAAVVIAVLHFIIGIFSFFMATIFREGFQLQVQQEYTI